MLEGNEGKHLEPGDDAFEHREGIAMVARRGRRARGRRLYGKKTCSEATSSICSVRALEEWQVQGGGNVRRKCLLGKALPTEVRDYQEKKFGEKRL